MEVSQTYEPANYTTMCSNYLTTSGHPETVVYLDSKLLFNILTTCLDLEPCSYCVLWQICRKF